MAGQNYVYPASISITSELSVGQNTLAAPIYSTQVAGQNPTGKLTPLSVDNAGNLNVNATLTGASTVTANQGTAGLSAWLMNLGQVGGASFSLGQQLAAASLPVVLTAAQLSTLTPLSTVTANQGSANATPWNNNISQWGGSATSLGQKVMASSVPVAFASDQSALPISAASLPLPTGAATSALQTAGNASLSSIDGKLADNFGVATGALRTAAQIGNASGAADFGSGASSAQTIRVIPATDTPAIPTKSPVNTNGSYAEITNLTTAAQTFTAPANAVGFILESPSDVNTSVLRWKIGAAATTTSGMVLEPGRDSGFVPCAANVSVIASTGSSQAANIQWILSS